MCDFVTCLFKKTVIYFCCLLLCSYFVISSTQAEVLLSEQTDSLLLGKQIVYLEDTNKQFTIENFISGKLDESLQQGSQEIIYLGRGHGRYWLKLPEFKNTSNQKEWYLVLDNLGVSFLEAVSFYFVADNKVVQQIDIPSVKDYLEKNRLPLISIPIATDLLSKDDLKIFVRSDVRGNVFFSLAIANTKITSDIYRKIIFVSLFTGAILLLVFYNLFTFIALKDKAYLFYVIYLLSWVIASSISLYKFEVLLGFYLDYEYRFLCYILAILSLIAFIYYFLDIQKNLKIANYILGFLAIAILASTLIAFKSIILAFKVFSLLSVILAFAALFIGIICFYKKQRQARFFIASWCVFILFICLWLSFTNGFIRYNFWIAHANLLATVVEALLLSFALSDKFQLFKVEIEKAYTRLKNATEQLIYAFGITVEIKDPYTAGHQFRVSELAVEIAKELRLTKEYTENVKLAALIHDIGKIGVASELLGKKEALDEYELGEIKEHVKTGYEIVKNLDIPQEIKEGILHHHERLDGSGYPSRIKDFGISLIGKILAVADTVEAVTNARPYRAALGLEKAFEIVKEQNYKFYDADIVNACQRVFNKGFKFPEVAQTKVKNS